jgi:hypothetical protein
MLRRVNNTRNVMYCHCMAQMVIHPGVTRKVHVRLKWPVYRNVKGLEFMIAVWRKREQTLHSVCISLIPLWTSANRGCLAKTYWSLFRRLGMCLSVLRILNLTLRHLPRWMELVFNASVVEVLFTSVCRTLFHNIAKIRKPFAALLVDLPHFRTAFTSRNSASRLVLLLSDLLLQVGTT